MSLTDRRPSIVERRPSSVSAFSSRRPSVIPQLEGIEKPNIESLPNNLDCDVLICGTGLIESILAAALSWQGSKVLHIDSNNYYGDNFATLTIEQIKNWFINSKLNKTGFKTYKNIKLDINDTDFKIISRDYGIDLSPKILFTKSNLLDLLIKSRVYHYLEFQSLSNFHTFEDNSLGKLVSSKEDIFTNDSLNLLSKRKLMKFLKFIVDENYINKIESEDLSISLKDYLIKNFKLEEKFINELIFTLGLINNPDIKTIDGLKRIRRYLLSFNVYGNFPTLYSKFGGPGEISQGFCRSAAVAGTIYKLNTKLINYDSKNKIANLNDGSKIKINEKIVSSLNQSYNKPENCKFYEIQRLICIVDKPCIEWFNEGESSSIVIFPPFSLNSQNKYPIECLIMGSGTGCCPKGKCIWYLHTIATNINDIAQNDLNEALKKLEESLIRESNFDFENFNEDDFNTNGLTQSGTIKLSESLKDFTIKNANSKVNYLMKLEFTQLTMVDQLNNENQFGFNSNIMKTKDGIIIPNMPSSELSYDGIIEESKNLYKEIVGDDVDFFDVDFEDEEDEKGINGYQGDMDLELRNSSVNGTASEHAIIDDDTTPEGQTDDMEFEL
jgi:RAB protein geranylgeranyltransferase component A